MTRAYLGLVCTKGKDPALKGLKSSLQTEHWFFIFLSGFKDKSTQKWTLGCVTAACLHWAPLTPCMAVPKGLTTGHRLVPLILLSLEEDFQDKTNTIRKLVSRAGTRWSIMATGPRGAEDGAGGKREGVSAKKLKTEAFYPWRGNLFMLHDSGPRELQQLGAPMSLYRQLKALCFHKAAFLLAVTWKKNI